jgi:hypothetical protein
VARLLALAIRRAKPAGEAAANAIGAWYWRTGITNGSASANPSSRTYTNWTVATVMFGDGFTLPLCNREKDVQDYSVAIYGGQASIAIALGWHP